MTCLVQAEDEEDKVGLAGAGCLSCLHDVMTKPMETSMGACHSSAVKPLGENSALLNSRSTGPTEIGQNGVIRSHGIVCTLH